MNLTTFYLNEQFAHQIISKNLSKLYQIEMADKLFDGSCANMKMLSVSQLITKVCGKYFFELKHKQIY